MNLAIPYDIVTVFIQNILRWIKMWYVCCNSIYFTIASSSSTKVDPHREHSSKKTEVGAPSEGILANNKNVEKFSTTPSLILNFQITVPSVKFSWMFISCSRSALTIMQLKILMICIEMRHIQLTNSVLCVFLYPQLKSDSRKVYKTYCIHHSFQTSLN